MITRISQCLPEGLANAAYDYISSINWKYGWRSNRAMGFGHWNQDVTNGVGNTTNGLEIANLLPDPINAIWTHIRSQHCPNSVLIRCYFNAHTFGVEGYPHRDSPREHDKTIVVYLNKEWKREWGGETIIYDGDIITHAELPKFNQALIFDGRQYHVAKPLSRICPELRVTMMFKFSNPDVDELRDSIQTLLMEVEANNIKHSHGTLMAHLLRTYDLLKEQNYDNIICGAGALHSIFGTNVFKHQTLTLADRNRVLEIVGSESMNLIELFSKLQRPRTLEKALTEGTTVVSAVNDQEIAISQDELNALCAIEAANLHDQKSLKTYIKIKQFYLLGDE